MIWRNVIVVLVVLAFLPVSRTLAQPQEWQPVALSDSLGVEIGTSQKDAYHLFPDVERFVSARFYTKDGTAYRMEYTYRTLSEKERVNSRRISVATWELTKAHVAIVEAFRRRNALPMPETEYEPETQYRLALKYASRGRYDLSRALLDDLLAEFPSRPAASEAAAIRADITRLAETKRALFLPGGLLDQSGRTDLLIFSGYYGVWAGLAIPITLKAKASEWYALGLLTGAPASLVLTLHLTKDASMGRGRSSIIRLGGHLGTWQGFGWAGLSNRSGNEVTGAGLLGGLAGITTAAILTHNVYFSEGHGALTSSAMNWGTWFGVTAGAVGGANDDNLLRAALIGSDVLVLATGVAARNARMSQARVRVISLMGYVGTVAGFGVDVLAQVNSGRAAMAIAGLGSIGGLVAGVNMTRNYDRGKDLASASPADGRTQWALTPQFTLAPDPSHAGRMMPSASLRLDF